MEFNILETINKLEKICSKLVEFVIEQKGKIDAEILEYDELIKELREFVDEYNKLDDSYRCLLGID